MIIGINFKVAVKGSGVVQQAPEWGKFLKWCGCSETSNASAGTIQYKFDSTTEDSGTIYIDLDRSILKVLGVRGSFKISAEAGKLCILEFEMKGLFSELVDGAISGGSLGVDTTTPPVVKNANFSVGGFSASANTWEFDAANETPGIPGFNATYEAIERIIISDRTPTSKINIEATTEAINPYFGDFLTSTEQAISIQVGNAATNKAIINNKMVYEKPNFGDLEGESRWELDGVASDDTQAGDSEFTLTLHDA